MTCRVGVLVSGGGTNLQALIDATMPHAHLALVISSHAGVTAIERAQKANIECIVIERQSMKADEYNERVLAELLAHNIDVVVLAGYLPIVGRSILTTYPGRILNIHPSLIPSFCGKGMYGIKVHEAVLAAGATQTGATVHFVDETIDGGAIVSQKVVDVLPGDTPEVLQQRVMQEAEWQLLPQAVDTLCEQLEKTPAQYFRHNSYPGRGIVVGISPAGRAVIAYFIMGRSDNSRNRVFTKTEDGIVTEPADPARVEDPSLIIYAPVRTLESTVIVTNGDQTDTIYDFLSDGRSFEAALGTRTFEPDNPNFTPRISGLVNVEDPISYALSILRRDGDGECQRSYFEYNATQNGYGHAIHTYQHDGDPLPSFSGEPVKVSISESIDTLTNELWDALDADNRISLFTQYCGLDGSTEHRIINRYDKR